jgi:hypothetical protein
LHFNRAVIKTHEHKGDFKECLLALKVGRSPEEPTEAVIAPSVAKPSAFRPFESDLGLPLRVIRF